jgi:hypothetical protein
MHQFLSENYYTLNILIPYRPIPALNKIDLSKIDAYQLTALTTKKRTPDNENDEC